MSLRFVPYEDLGHTPNIIVDGAAAAATLLTLSHWPRSGTPAALRDDLSAQIVFRYLDQPAIHVEASAASNNHFDEDGLIGLYTILHPEAARARRDLLIDVAAAGDFGTYRLRDAARVAFTLAAFASPDRSPLDPGLFERPYASLAAALYQELLPRLPEMLSSPEQFRRHWEEQEALLEQSETAIRAHRITIDEVPGLDLAVVTLPETIAGSPWPRFVENREAACHPLALHNCTRCFRILLMQGHAYELAYRYESWVQYVSSRPAPRVDLAPLAEALSQAESGDARWEFDGVEETTPALRLRGAEASRIAPERFRRQVQEFLASAPPAWDPYDPA